MNKHRESKSYIQWMILNGKVFLPLERYERKKLSIKLLEISISLKTVKIIALNPVVPLFVDPIDLYSCFVSFPRLFALECRD